MNSVFAIDPGSEQSAYCLLNSKTNKITAEILSNVDLLWRIDLLYKTDPRVDVAIEMIASYGMPVGKEVFETCVWVGRFHERIDSQFDKVLTSSGYRLNPPKLIYRKDIKMYVCGSHKANDSTIRASLIDVFGAPGTKNNPGATYGISKDKWAALAVAATAIKYPGFPGSPSKGI